MVCEAGKMPSQELITKMMKFNEDLVRAGVMLAGDGLTPTSKAKHVRFSGSQRSVIDGPFAESKEIIAGYWIWQRQRKSQAPPSPQQPAGSGRSSPAVPSRSTPSLLLAK
jgi:hypothetical protein